MAPVAQDSSTIGSRLDGPPPLPPKLSDKSAPDLASTQAGDGGTPPTGELASIVLEHAQLCETILVSLSRMLPSFTPVAAQIQASLRLGVVKALKDSVGAPQQSLAQGAGPSIPPQGAQPSPGGMPGPPPPGAGAAPPAVGAGPQ